jgi:hypothetical protein
MANLTFLSGQLVEAAVTSARCFFFFWWDFLGVDGAMVGVRMEGRWVGVG